MGNRSNRADGTALRRFWPLIVIVALLAALVFAAMKAYDYSTRAQEYRSMFKEHLRASQDLHTKMLKSQDLYARMLKSQDLYAKALKGYESEVLGAMLAQKVEELVSPSDSPQEKCLKIARWIAENISNANSSPGDYLKVFATRSGSCGSRSMLFVEMLKYLNMTARLFNMYNFGRIGGGHSCVQVFYDDQWHFFDVSYAGVFMHEGKVLSWDEIKADPETALKGMVVFPHTRDRSFPSDSVDRRRAIERPGDFTPVQNTRRMTAVYTRKSIDDAVTYGFKDSPDVKMLHARVDLGTGHLPITLGDLNQQYRDVSAAGASQMISEQLGTLGTIIDTFQVRWCFENVQQDREYSIRYICFKPTRQVPTFWAKGEGCTITRGQSFSPVFDFRATQVWEIAFRPWESGRCSVEVGYDFRELRRGILVDQIIIDQHEIKALTASDKNPSSNGSNK